MIDGIAQPLVSLLALALWSYVVVIARGRMRVLSFVLWSVSMAYAIQSLTYLDIIDRDTVRAVTFVTRVGLAAAAVALVVIWRRRWSEE